MPFVEDRDPLIRTLKRVAYNLKLMEVPFALAGSLAVYARGGGPVDHDVDFLIKEEDTDRTLTGLIEVGFRAVIPPEGWLVKVYEDERLVDLIFNPVQRPVTDETLADTDVLPVNACHMPVLSATELMIHKLLSMGVQACDFTRALPVARSLREQIDWGRVERETAYSPYAQAFMVLLDRLKVISLAEIHSASTRRATLKEVTG
jgi:hypothetical protein